MALKDIERCVAIDERSGKRCGLRRAQGMKTCEKHFVGEMEEVVKRPHGYSDALVGHSNVRELYEKFRDDAALVGLREELALQKSLLSAKVKDLVTSDDYSLTDRISHVNDCVDGIRRTVETISRTESKLTVMIHVTHVQALLGAVVKIVGEETGGDYQLMERVSKRVLELSVPDGSASERMDSLMKVLGEPLKRLTKDPARLEKGRKYLEAVKEKVV